MKDILDALKAMIDAVEGDGSTEFMPDVTRADAAIWMLLALDKAGFELKRKIEPF